MNSLIKYFPIAYFTVILFPMLAGAESFFFHNKYISIPIRYPAFFILLAILIPVLWKIFSSHKGQELAEAFRNTTWITVPFLAVGVISTIWGIHPDAYWERGLKFIVLDLYHWLLLMISIAIACSETIRKHHRIIFFITLLGIGYGIWVDFFFPGTFSDVGHRAAGFTQNANDGARLMILLCIASIDWKKSGLINLIALTYAALAIFATLSVSNLLMFLLVVAFYLIINLKVDGHIFRKFATVGLVPIIIFYVIHPLILNMVSSSELFDNRTSTGRIDQISQMFEGDLGFAENHERVNLVSEYVGHIQQAPLIGRGTGFSESQVSGPHNMYLKHWADNGIPGLLAYLLMIAGSFRHFLVLRDVRGMIFVFIVFCAGFFDHNLLNIMTIVSLLGIFGTLAYLDSSKQVNIADPKSSPVL